MEKRKMSEKYTRDDVMHLLQDKQQTLEAMGELRFPKRSDFSEEEVVAIKAFLGPWPRALEAAGLKPMREDDQETTNLQKRILAKRRRNAALREDKKGR